MAEPDVRPEGLDGPLRVLWQDDRLVAVHKPAGWLVHRTWLDAHETRFVMQTLRDQLGQHVYPVHRLDKGTSGVLLMALDPDAARAMSLLFEAHQTHKDYVALVRGWPLPETRVDHALKPDDAPDDALPQSAVTRFQRLATLQLDVPVDHYPSTRVALVQAQPETGRRHQIRRHLKHLAHPIIGDATHGKGRHNRWWAEQLGQQRLWLHALRLDFMHPFSGQLIQIVSDWHDATLNADWCRLQQSWPWQFDAPQPAPERSAPQ
jgi:tRNA pseudouridine65 synthase